MTENEIEELLEKKEVKVGIFFGLIQIFERTGLGRLIGFLTIIILIYAFPLVILLLFAYFLYLAVNKGK